MKQVLGAFARNTVFANILLLLIFFAGGLASLSMIRESFPEFSMDAISITVDYPGADPEEVEEGVSQKIEEALDAVEGVDQYTTRSMENRASVTVEVKDGYEVTRVLDQVKSRVNAISTFPQDAERPVIVEVVRKESVLLLALSGQRYDGRTKTLTVKPVINRSDFRCLFTASAGYGSFAQRRGRSGMTVTVACVDGQVGLSGLVLGRPGRAAPKATCKLNGLALPAEAACEGADLNVRLGRRVTLKAADRLQLRLR